MSTKKYRLYTISEKDFEDCGFNCWFMFADNRGKLIEWYDSLERLLHKGKPGDYAADTSGFNYYTCEHITKKEYETYKFFEML